MPEKSSVGVEARDALGAVGGLSTDTTSYGPSLFDDGGLGLMCFLRCRRFFRMIFRCFLSSIRRWSLMYEREVGVSLTLVLCLFLLIDLDNWMRDQRAW